MVLQNPGTPSRVLKNGLLRVPSVDLGEDRGICAGEQWSGGSVRAYRLGESA